MKYCVIDIGSNSVRLMLNENGVTVYKKVKMTRLAENLGKERFLCSEAINRTVNAVKEFYFEAKKENPLKIYIFATAAVRQAKNGSEFCQIIRRETGLCVDVVSGEIEAKLGVMGALKGENGGLIDIGGASTEVAIIEADKRFSKSYKIGAGTLTERLMSENLNKVLDEIFYDLPSDLNNKFTAIGGTATSVSAMMQELEIYNPKLVDGFFIKKENLLSLKEKLSSLSVNEIAKLKGLQKGRERVIYAGVCILFYLMDKLNLSGVFVSESDNLEGYLQYIRGENE